LIRNHYQYTKSAVARKTLDDWDEMLPQFVKVYPRDYRLVLEQQQALEKAAMSLITDELAKEQN